MQKQHRGAFTPLHSNANRSFHIQHPIRHFLHAHVDKEYPREAAPICFSSSHLPSVTLCRNVRGGGGRTPLQVIPVSRPKPGNETRASEGPAKGTLLKRDLLRLLSQEPEEPLHSNIKLIDFLLHLKPVRAAGSSIKPVILRLNMQLCTRLSATALDA